ncbi:MAG: hypothetical protein AB4042_03480 [Leptolyngbyaceae cyanobacterium]
MTTPQLLQQAKQGDPEAIAQLMNHSLKPKGIEATVARNGDRLQVLLTSANVVNQAVLTQFVQNGIQNLNIPDITMVELVGQAQSNPGQPWSQVFTLDAASSPTSSPPQSPPPPPTATPPVVPPLPSPVTVVQPPLAESPSASLPPSTADENSPESFPTAPTAVDQPYDKYETGTPLVDELSLDDELSMDTIDQIVADAMQEVTTKIQSEIPFDPDEGITDSMDTLSETGSTDASLAGMERTAPSLNAPLPESGANALDSALEQAIQTGQLDDLNDLISSNLDLTDAIAEDELAEDELAEDEPDDTPSPQLPVLRLPIQNLDHSDLDENSSVDPFSNGSTDGLEALETAEGTGISEPQRSVSATSGASTEEEVDSESAVGVLDNVETDGTNADGTNADGTNAGGTNADGTENDGDGQSPSSDNKPASSILLALVSALTFGSIAGLVGYSIQSYGGNWYQVIAGEAIAPNTTNDADESTGNPPPEAFPTAPPDEDGTTAATGSDAETGADVEPEATPTTETEDTNTASPVATTLQPPDAAIANCPAIIASPGQTLTLSQIQIDPDTPPAGGIYTIVGCLTNHTDSTVVAATLDYEGRLTADASAKGSMYFDAPSPKATVPFRTRLTLPADASTIQIKGIIWNLDGEAAQTLPLEFSLPLTDDE